MEGSFAIKAGVVERGTCVPRRTRVRSRGRGGKLVARARVTRVFSRSRYWRERSGVMAVAMVSSVAVFLRSR